MDISTKFGYNVERNTYGNVVSVLAFYVKREMDGTQYYDFRCEVTRFFKTQCPYYQKGQGLMILMPMTITSLIAILANYLRSRLKRIIKKRYPTAKGPYY